MLDSMDHIEKYIHENIETYSKGNSRLSDVAYECLKDAILSVDVQSGDALSEPRLSAALGISRTPVRTAIQQLMQNGLLQQIPSRVIMIASRSIKQILEALEIRRLLEPEVCRLVSGNLSSQQIGELKQCTYDLLSAAKTKDRQSWSRIDVQWHEMLCLNCSNQLLGQMVMQAKHHMHHQGVGDQVSDDYLLAGTEEHSIIVDAIILGDGDAAAHLMLEHLDGVRRYLYPTPI